MTVQAASDSNAQQQRAELHRAIWQIANDLRGSVDGWDFKNYVLGTLFYRYVSESLTNFVNRDELEAHLADGGTRADFTFDYAKLSDAQAMTIRDDLVSSRGYFIRPSMLFANVVADCEDNENLNETVTQAFGYLETSTKGHDSEKDFDGLFSDFDVNSNKLGGSVKERNQRLARLLRGIESMSLGNLQDNSIDAFGDAYEYLMAMYAANAGKSGGEYFTPQQVSHLLTRLALGDKKSVNKVYDPACGSGSLLLQSAKILGKDNVRTGFFGQELNITTYNLCRINMFLHDIDYDKFDIAHGDTLTTPKHWDDEPFEVIVSNPPYSVKWDGDNNPQLIDDDRFSPAGTLAPKSKADLAFVMHSLAWLADNGAAAIVCFPGIFYRGGAEAKIRKYLVDNNFVEAVIELPRNLFFGTSISTCILVLKKNKTTSDIVFIDASREFEPATNSNVLTDANIDTIFRAAQARADVAHFVKVVPNAEIGADYNLSPSTYVEKEDTREKVDIAVLNAQIAETVAKVDILRSRIAGIVAEISGATSSVEAHLLSLARANLAAGAVSFTYPLVETTYTSISVAAPDDDEVRAERLLADAREEKEVVAGSAATEHDGSLPNDLERQLRDIGWTAVDVEQRDGAPVLIARRA